MQPTSSQTPETTPAREEETEPITELPDYALHLQAFHQAFAADLSRLLAALELSRDDRILDVPCGDGFYAISLARHLNPQTAIVAADHSSAYLKWAGQYARKTGVEDNVCFCQADVYQLPFEDDSFDFIWCAQSLISLAQPVSALRELRRVLRPGGRLAVLENDHFHQMLLPWPVELELALLQAIRQHSLDRFGAAHRLCPGRFLKPLFQAAEFRSYYRQTQAIDRQGPLDEATQTYLIHYFRSLADIVQPYLKAEMQQQLHSFSDPTSSHYLPQRPDFEMTFLNLLSVGTR